MQETLVSDHLQEIIFDDGTITQSSPPHTWMYLKLLLVLDILHEGLETIDVVKVEVSQDDSSDGLAGDLSKIPEDIPGKRWI